MTSSGALLGKNILVTRPSEQAETLTRLIRGAGGVPFVFPAIEIIPPSLPDRLEEILARLDQYDLAIFISPTAVSRTWTGLPVGGPPLGAVTSTPTPGMSTVMARILTTTCEK